MKQQVNSTTSCKKGGCLLQSISRNFNTSFEDIPKIYKNGEFMDIIKYFAEDDQYQRIGLTYDKASFNKS